MLISPPVGPPASEITPEHVYHQRRQLLLGTGAALLAAAVPVLGQRARAAQLPAGESFGELPAGPFGTDETRTPWRSAVSYNNFYEFGTDKSDPVLHADAMTTDPWSLRVDGEVHQPRTLALEDVLKPAALEERVYRLRCVEGWSMVIPWVGFPLRDLLQRFEPTGNARFVEFTTLARPEEMRGLRRPILDWPYREGLRLDEAMHPLTFLAVGLYGKVLPNQNGAPIRLVVPWKYGFKSSKSIVRIRFTAEQPKTAWNQAAPQEYGFYSNVNPDVPHPRWSQAHERRIGEQSGFSALFARKDRETLMFNGYGEQVASLYAGMDLRKHF